MNALSGRRVVVTRALHQADELVDALRMEDATVLLCPTIAIAPPDHPADLIAAASRANEFDWIIFSSANAVSAFQAELTIDPATLSAKIATIGDATRQHAEALGFNVSLMPESYVAEALIGAFRGLPLADTKILIPRAAVSRDIIPTELRKLGAVVTVVEAYRNVVAPHLHDLARKVFTPPLPNWVLFASSSAVEHLIPVTGTGIFEQISIASIGPVTTATLRRNGLKVQVEAAEYSAKGLVAALCRFVSSQ